MALYGHDHITKARYHLAVYFLSYRLAVFFSYRYYRYGLIEISVIPIYAPRNTGYIGIELLRFLLSGIISVFYRLYRYVSPGIPYLPICMYSNTVFTDISVPEYRIYRYMITEFIGISVSATRYTVYTDMCYPVYCNYR